jgi:hypothetical protein
MTWSYGDWHEDRVALYDDSNDTLVCWLQKQGGISTQALTLVKAAPEMLAALADTVTRLEMIASDMRGGLLGHNIGLADYEAGVRRCYERAAAAIAKAEGRDE